MILRGHHPIYQFDFFYYAHDVFIGRPLAAGKYELFESELYRAAIKPDSVVMDVGANIGYYTLLAAGTIDPALGRVYAFEPNVDHFAILQQNLAHHGIDYAFAHQLAVGEREGEVNLYLSDTNPGDHQVYDSGEGRRIQAVRMVALDDFIAEHGIAPDLVKIDTQGYDYNVLLGMKDLLARDCPLTLFTEFWPHGNRNAGVSTEDHYRTLIEHFETVEMIYRDEWEVAPATLEAVMDYCALYDGTNHADLLCRR